jgi:hypothetical protein
LIKTLITNGSVGKKTTAEVTEGNALKVATVDYNMFGPAFQFFTHGVHGIDLNKNFSNEAAGNANEIIHNGTDSDEWTGSAINGTWDVAATNNPDTGSKNIEKDTGGGAVADTVQFLRASNVTMDAHTGISGRIYITQLGHNLAELVMFAWDSGTSSIVGNTVNIYDYINPTVTGVYQTFNIPLVDMGLIGTTFDAVRFAIEVKAGAIFDLDNIVLNDPTGGEGLGTSIFTLNPPLGELLYVDGFLINMAGPHVGTFPDGTMPNIPYNSLLNVPKLASPMIFQVRGEDVGVRPIFTFSQIIDFMVGKPEIKFVGSDGTNSWISIYISLPAPIILDDTLSQQIGLSISSDLSELDYLRWNANCRNTGY